MSPKIYILFIFIVFDILRIAINFHKPNLSNKHLLHFCNIDCFVSKICISHIELPYKSYLYLYKVFMFSKIAFMSLRKKYCFFANFGVRFQNSLRAIQHLDCFSHTEVGRLGIPAQQLEKFSFHLTHFLKLQVKLYLNPMKQRTLKRCLLCKNPTKKRLLRKSFFKWWVWRDSNPRPID